MSKCLAEQCVIYFTIQLVISKYLDRRLNVKLLVIRSFQQSLKGRKRTRALEKFGRVQTSRPGEAFQQKAICARGRSTVRLFTV